MHKKEKEKVKSPERAGHCIYRENFEGHRKKKKGKQKTKSLTEEEKRKKAKQNGSSSTYSSPSQELSSYTFTSPSMRSCSLLLLLHRCYSLQGLSFSLFTIRDISIYSSHSAIMQISHMNMKHICRSVRIIKCCNSLSWGIFV